MKTSQLLAWVVFILGFMFFLGGIALAIQSPEFTTLTLVGFGVEMTGGVLVGVSLRHL